MEKKLSISEARIDMKLLTAHICYKRNKGNEQKLFMVDII